MRRFFLALAGLLLASMAFAGDALNVNPGSGAHSRECRYACPNFTLLGNLQIGSGRVLSGATKTTDNLDLAANTQTFASTNTGRIRFLERLSILPNTAYAWPLAGARRFIDFPSTTVHTLSDPGSFSWIAARSEMKYTVDSPVYPVFIDFSGNYRFTAPNTVTDQQIGIDLRPIYIADGVDTTLLAGVGNGHTAAFQDGPTLQTANSGTWNATTSYESFESAFTTGGFTMASGLRLGFAFVGSAGGGGFGTETAFTASGMTGTTNNYVLDSNLTAGSGNYFLHDTGGAKTKLNNVDYTWPASAGATGSNLEYNAGTLTWTTSNKYALATTIEAGGGL